MSLRRTRRNRVSLDMAPTETLPTLTQRLVLVVAVAAGVAAANLYYPQPLLHTIVDDLGTGEGAAGLVVTTSQLGFASALALLLPEGDLIDRRRLAPRLLVGAAICSIGIAIAPSLAVVAVVFSLGSCVVVA